MSNDDSFDPLMSKLRTERSLYKQYNIAAIQAEGVDNLPRRWKKLSPLNRLKAKMQVDRYKNKQASMIPGIVSPPEYNRIPNHIVS